MTTFDWQIVQMTRRTVDGFVTSVDYLVFAEDAGCKASVFNTVSYEYKEGQDYKLYESLTPQEVISWVWASVDKTAIEADLTAQIQAAKNPTSQTGLPWNVQG